MKKYSPQQLERYPIYLKLLREMAERGETTVSSPRLAAVLDYSEEAVRKDFQAISTSPGVPKKGRDIVQLIDDLEAFLGYKSPRKAAVIGTGHMGGALLSFRAFTDMGLDIVCGFDVNSTLQGQSIAGKSIYALDEFALVQEKENIEVAVLCVPSLAAQEVAEMAYGHGIRAFWNFAPVVLSLPYDAVVENVNLASSLAVLSHKIDRAKSRHK